MAITNSRYNHTARKVLGADIALASCKVMLLSNAALFDPTHTTLAQVAGAGNVNEIAGNGWPVGGQPITLSATTVDTDGAVLGGENLSVLAVGGQIGPAYKAVLYDDTAVGDPVLWFFDLGAAMFAAETTNFLFQLPDGLFDVRDS